MSWDWDEHGIPGGAREPVCGNYDSWKTQYPPWYDTDDGPCETCGGYGEHQTPSGRAVECQDCDGPVVGKKRCWPCRGSGVVQKTEQKLASGIYVTVLVDCPKCRRSGKS